MGKVLIALLGFFNMSGVNPPREKEESVDRVSAKDPFGSFGRRFAPDHNEFELIGGGTEGIDDS